MILQADISPEELKVFMEEADEHIQVLDRDLIKLENDGRNPEILQRIFRAAHTLKGSSGMLGHKRMADVTHAMESLLDRLRNGKLEVCSEVIDSLLFGLDAIKVLKDEVTAGEECGLDVCTVVAQLTQATDQSDHSRKSTKNKARQAAGAFEQPIDEFKLDSKEIAKVRDALESGHQVYRLTVSIADKSEWKAVRCLQVLTELGKESEVLASRPTSREIEQEKAGTKLCMILGTDNAEDKISQVARSVADIEAIKITPYALNTTGKSDEESLRGKKTNPEKPATVTNSTEIINSMTVTKSESLQSIRVDVKMLDTLMNMVEELVIDRARISQVGRQLENRYPEDDLVDHLGDTSNHIIKVINALHQDIMKVRMVPVSLVFNKFPRLVRDIAQKQQKNLEFVVKGEETELDRTIIEQIHDPLIHLLRNAVDHGIEPPQERAAKGKPVKATVRLSAFQEEGHIIITLDDDGRGIDPVKVRDAAVGKGFMPRESVDQLSDAEAIDLIFSPGMSTASKVTDVSGRGVGLDIVRTNIERLNGTSHLDTELGEGTRFTVKLPLTVAVFQGLMVSAGDMTLIVPLVSVVETIRINSGDIKTVLGQEVMRLREGIVPLVRLGAVLGANGHTCDADGEQYVIVVKAADKLAGFVVDRLMEQQEFVIKALGKHIGEVKGIAGATILGDGNVALILDVPTLIRSVIQQGKTLSVKNSQVRQ
jgi:two-component system chemotaxis sensor kinase CheA